jgi:predicted nucleic acid-binding protein
LNVILDSCSTINLHNGDVLEKVLQLGSSKYAFHMGTIVRGECGDLTAYLDEQANKGRILILPGKTITPSHFADLLNRYELGLGETECIVHAERHVLTVCTDDGAARAAAKAHLGEARVVGSLRLIRECVCAGIITPNQAYVGYELTKSRGGFLPEILPSYFNC